MGLPQVGQKAARSLKVTAEQVEQYAQITGDRNPLHFDEAFAARTKFGGLVVQGGAQGEQHPGASRREIHREAQQLVAGKR